MGELRKNSRSGGCGLREKADESLAQQIPAQYQAARLRKGLFSRTILKSRLSLVVAHSRLSQRAHTPAGEEAHRNESYARVEDQVAGPIRRRATQCGCRTLWVRERDV